MPVCFLTEAERVRLSGFLVEVSPDILIIFFTLFNSDLVHVRKISART
jgi:hypothetical protein